MLPFAVGGKSRNVPLFLFAEPDVFPNGAPGASEIVDGVIFVRIAQGDADDDLQVVGYIQLLPKHLGVADEGDGDDGTGGRFQGPRA